MVRVPGSTWVGRSGSGTQSASKSCLPRHAGVTARRRTEHPRQGGWPGYVTVNDGRLEEVFTVHRWPHLGMPPKSVRNRSPTFTPGHRCEQTGKCIIHGIKPGAPFRSVNTCHMSLHSTVVIVLIYVTHNRPISLSHIQLGVPYCNHRSP